jgi:hypothetical protein
VPIAKTSTTSVHETLSPQQSAGRPKCREAPGAARGGRRGAECACRAFSFVRKRVAACDAASPKRILMRSKRALECKALPVDPIACLRSTLLQTSPDGRSKDSRRGAVSGLCSGKASSEDFRRKRTRSLPGGWGASIARPTRTRAGPGHHCHAVACLRAIAAPGRVFTAGVARGGAAVATPRASPPSVGGSAAVDGTASRRVDRRDGRAASR